MFGVSKYFGFSQAAAAYCDGILVALEFGIRLLDRMSWVLAECTCL